MRESTARPSPDTPRSLVDQLRHLLDEVRLLRPALERLPDGLIEAKPQGKWSVKEVLGHLADMDELVFEPRLRRIVEEETPVFESVDQDAVAAERDWNARPLADALDAVVTQRAAIVDVLGTLSEADWHRTGTWPDGQTRAVADVVVYAARHDAHHLRDLGYRLYGTEFAHRS